jgi:SAM-dependent methyltransferase
VNWQRKSQVLRVLSALPRGHDLHYLFQRFVTKSLPVSDDALASSVRTAKTHIDNVLPLATRPLDEQTWFEFGAGWNLALPLANCGFGVKSQIVIDIRPLIRTSLLNDAVRRLRAKHFETLLDRDLPEADTVNALRSRYGIHYQAPSDARATGLAPGSIDVVTSTSTLEHIGAEDIEPIFRECRRVLRDDGVMSMYINYKDHYAAVDSTITPYNFLQYSPEEWSGHSPALHFQNRLRHVDYVRMLERTGFEIISVNPVTIVGPEELKILQATTLDPAFQNYGIDELATQDAFIVARKSNGWRAN